VVCGSWMRQLAVACTGHFVVLTDRYADRSVKCGGQLIVQWASDIVWRPCHLPGVMIPPNTV
jgi:hypothetical protein